MREKRIRVPRANAMYIDPVDLYTSRRILPSAAQEVDSVPSCRKPSEDLMKVKLGASRLGILAVLPVENKNPH